MNRDRVAFPADRLLRVERAGCYRHADRSFAVVHRLPTLAIHVYGYAARLRRDGAACTVTPGDLTITPAGVGASYDVPTAGEHWCLHVEAPPAGARGLVLPSHIALGPAAPAARERIARIARHLALAATCPAAATAASAALLEMLAWLATWDVRPHQPVSASDLAVERAATILGSDLARGLRIAAVAAQVGLGRNWLSIRFRQRYGQTMARFRLAARIAEARSLIEATDLPLADIGRRVGLPDAQHFNKRFRQAQGQPPSALRRRPG